MLPIDREQLVDLSLQTLDALGWVSPGDAIEQHARGDLLLADGAAVVGGRDSSTLAKWAQSCDDEGDPIAIKVGQSWLYITQRLLRYIQRRFGSYARREAETRLRKFRETRAGTEISTPNAF